MKIVFKRVVAYMIDIIIVSLLTTFIISNPYINKDYKEYTKISNEYISYNEKYVDKIEKLNDNLEKNEITQNEYEKQENKINKEYEKKLIDYNYKLVKLSIISSIISVLIVLLYFVFIQNYFDGKTLGKWLMKLRVVSVKSKLGILNLFLRSLIINSVFITILNIIFVMILSKNNYLIYNQISYIISYIVEMTTMIMILFNKNNRGLHDYIGNTKVILEGENNEV